MKHLFLSLFLFLFVQALWAQPLAPGKYWVQFTDKHPTQYQLDNPEEYLSARALQRRQQQGIAIDSTDLPVARHYVDSIQRFHLQVLYTSKWLNAAVVASDDTSIMSQLSEVSFVSDYHQKLAELTNWQINRTVAEIPYSLNQEIPDDADLLAYGEAANQVKMLNTHILHGMGFKGEDMLLAVLDAGFYQAHQLPAFDSLFTENRVIDQWDYVANQPLSYEESGHGMKALSCMAANIPGELVGTAPRARYCLYRTEDAHSEYPIEEANWVAAIERADSLGVDLINSSLGYSTFDDPAYHHTYQDMNGRSTLISLAADMAAAKGIIPVVSAGNEGSSSWQYITAPADGHHLLAVGAVDANENRVSFSSRGPTFDNRIKPDIAAKGLFAAVQDYGGNIGFSNGTSFASPIAAGSVACLWQARPQLSNLQIIQLVRETAKNAKTPDSLLGYGVADMRQAYLYPTQTMGLGQLMDMYPNPFEDSFTIDMEYFSHKATYISVYSLMGQKLFERYIPPHTTPSHLINPEQFRSLPQGVYLIQVRNGKQRYSTKIIKQ